MTVVAFHNAFPRMAAGMTGGIEPGVRQAAVEIAVDAQAAAPRDTGALAASCKSDPLERTATKVSWAAYAGDTQDGSLRPDGRPVDYAIYQEFGTRFMAAQPFFFPAVERLRGDFPVMVETALIVHLRELAL